MSVIKGRIVLTGSWRSEPIFISLDKNKGTAATQGYALIHSGTRDAASLSQPMSLLRFSSSCE